RQAANEPELHRLHGPAPKHREVSRHGPATGPSPLPPPVLRPPRSQILPPAKPHLLAIGRRSPWSQNGLPRPRRAGKSPVPAPAVHNRPWYRIERTAGGPRSRVCRMPSRLGDPFPRVLFQERDEVNCQVQEITLELVGLGFLDLFLSVINAIER